MNKNFVQGSSNRSNRGKNNNQKTSIRRIQEKGGGKGINSGANLVAALQENTATMKAMMAATGGGGGEGGDRPAEIVVNMGTQQLRLAARVLNGAINNLPEKDIALRYDGVGRA